MKVSLKKVGIGSLGIFATLGLSTPAFAASASTPPTYTPGTLVQFAHSPTVFLVGQHTLHWVPNPRVLYALGDSWAQVLHQATSSGRPPIGSSVTYFQVQGQTPIYYSPVIHPGHVYAMPFPSNYQTTGSPNPTSPYQPPSSAVHSVATMGDLPGTPTSWPQNKQAITPYEPMGLVQVAGQSPVYFFNGIANHWIPSAALFLAAGYTWNAIHVLPALQYPTGFPTTLVQARSSTKVYVLSHGQLHWIPSAAMFQALGYRWNEVTSVNRLPYPIGSPI